MRRLRYNVAMTLDGFIADPSGGYDWIIMDPAIDFAGLFAEFDTFVMGRKTFEVTRKTEFMQMIAGKEIVVFSRTLAGEEYPDVRVTRESPPAVVRDLKNRPGKDIWLFGGGDLFRQLADADLVDIVEVAVMPVMLTQGIPVLPAGGRLSLALQSGQILPSGIVMLSYAVSSS